MDNIKNLIGVALNMRPRDEVILREEIIPIEGEFSIYFNGLPVGKAKLTQIGMTVYNLSGKIVYYREEMRLQHRRALLKAGIDALKEDYLNIIYPK